MFAISKSWLKVLAQRSPVVIGSAKFQELTTSTIGLHELLHVSVPLDNHVVPLASQTSD